MDKWKSQLDAHLKVKEEQDRKREASRREQIRKDMEAARAEALRKLGRRFKCHVCGKPSSAPYLATTNFMGNSTESHEIWDTPGDLEKCRRCGKWTCSEHMHQNFCMHCAQRV
ncbi:MAG: hypothetical protein HYT50_01620 [Candidatus Wildermuthbacteria bacterium]|nr:hypothetical protein [Candidatus Wildermuthbacteria bacterium]